MLQRCNLCTNRVKFVSIEKSLGEQLDSYGFPYDLDRFETLNYKQYACPVCGSGDRDRLYKLYFDKFLSAVYSPIELVDFAPAPSLQSYLNSNRKINYRSSDLYMEGVDDTVDITNMKEYKDNRFDFFVCSHILEHVDDRKALKELHRILKPGGQGILMTPIIDDDSVFDEDMTVTDVNERWKRFAQDDHVRLYSKSVFLERVGSAGFNIQQLSVINLGIINFLKYGIGLKSVLYIVSKAEEEV